jgi:nitroimidazol reductase NimA-like FMN-containing flavoprotein (pyridoxamine 5'-phosphate oxidase superfamily)
MTSQWTPRAAVDHLDEALMYERLRRARFARIAYVDGDQPVVVPVNIATGEDQRVVLRTAADSALAGLDGRRVAIELDGHDTGLRTGWSILVLGMARDITEAHDVDARRWRRIAVDTWAPGVRDRLLVVVPSSITGRVIRPGADGDWFAGVPGS